MATCGEDGLRVWELRSGKNWFCSCQDLHASCGSTAVEHLTLHAKVRGSSRGATVVGEKEKLKVCVSICV